MINGTIMKIIGAAILIIALPILVTASVNARNTTGASTNFTSGLDISDLLMGLAPTGVLLALVLGFRRVRG